MDRNLFGMTAYTLESLANRLGIIRTSLAQAMSPNIFSTTKLGEIAEAPDVPVWQLFISPDIFNWMKLETSPTLTCPHFDNEIKITLE